MAAVTYTQLHDAVRGAQLGTGAAELHGSIAGYLCAGWGGRAPELLGALELEPASAAAAGTLHALVDGVAADILRKLRTREAVRPLLPEAGMAARANAMVDWCRGFLGGIGLTGVRADAAHAVEAQALLADLGQIAAMHLECDADDAAALDDVLDFIGSAVTRLHELLAPAALQ